MEKSIGLKMIIVIEDGVLGDVWINRDIPLEIDVLDLDTDDADEFDQSMEKLVEIVNSGKWVQR